MNNKNLIILTYWNYKDPLIQTYTLPYVRIIKKQLSPTSKIHLITFENLFHQIHQEELKQIKKELSEEGIILINFPYNRFGIKAILNAMSSFAFLLKLCIIHKIEFIHCWCTPAGSLGYVLSKCTGIPLILDSYEPHAEAMVENGTWKKQSISFNLLFLLEKLQSKRAKYVIATSSGMQEYASKKYKVDLRKKFFVKPACVDMELFSFKRLNSEREEIRKQYGFTGKIVCVYAGKIGGIYLGKEIFHFIITAIDFWKDNFRILLLTNEKSENIEQYLSEFNIDKKYITFMFADHKNVSKYLSASDFAFNPVKSVPTKKYCTSIKDGEYWAMGLPVIITKNISDDSAIIQENKIGAVIQTLNTEGYLNAIKTIDDILINSNKKQLQENIRNIASEKRNYRIAESIYKKLYM